MGTQADQYRERARDADDNAKRVKDPDAKDVYLQIAEHWRVKAALADLYHE